MAARERRRKRKNTTHHDNYCFSVMSHSPIPFCLRTDRSVWMKCVHCSTFPLCIQSNMSPPLTEHTGIGCMMMMTGAQTQQAQDRPSPDKIRTGNQTVSSNVAPAPPRNRRANLILRLKVTGDVSLLLLFFADLG